MVRRATARNVSISVPVSLVVSFSLCFSQITQSIEWLQLASLLLQKYRNLWQAFLTEQKICSPFVTTCQFTYSSFWFSRLHKFTRTKLSWLTNCFSGYFKCWEEIFMLFWPVLLRWSSINWKCLCSFLNSKIEQIFTVRTSLSESALQNGAPKVT